jgi:chitinase
MWGRHDINQDATMTSYIQAEPDRAVKNMKDVMTAMKYLQDSTINTRLKAEKERVAARLKELDETKMPSWVRKTGNNDWAKWTSKGLEGKWNSFMKKQATKAKDKAVKYMDDNIKLMKAAYVTEFNKDLAERPGAENEVLKKLIEKIEKLETEWIRYKPNSWGNPF